MWDTIIFDLDGTLTDSGPGIINGLVYAVEKLGLPPRERSFYRAFIGPPLLPALRGLLGLDEETARAAVKTYREYYVDRGILENEPYPGIPELLRDLRAAGKRVMVATSKPEVMARRVLEHFGLAPHIDCLAGASLDESRDMKAESIGRCVEGAAGCAVMVGDRKYDVEGAGKNYLPTVGVTYGYGSREELEEAGAGYIVDTVAELGALLLGREG